MLYLNLYTWKNKFFNYPVGIWNKFLQKGDKFPCTGFCYCCVSFIACYFARNRTI